VRCGKMNAPAYGLMRAPIVAEHCARDPATRDPEVRGCHFATSRDDGIRQSNLTIELARARLHGDRPRRRRRLHRFIYDRHRHAESREPQGQNQTRWPCTDDDHGRRFSAAMSG
jgi:hypothetical protein